LRSMTCSVPSVRPTTTATAQPECALNPMATFIAALRHEPWLSAPSERLQAHHGPLRLAPRHFLEPFLVVHRLGAEPHRIVAGSCRLVHGIRLDQARAL